MCCATLKRPWPGPAGHTWRCRDTTCRPCSFRSTPRSLGPRSGLTHRSTDDRVATRNGGGASVGAHADAVASLMVALNVLAVSTALSAIRAHLHASLPRHPPGVLGDLREHPPQIVIIHRRHPRRGEHQPVILPQRPGREPVRRLSHPVLPSASTHVRGSASVRRDSGVLVSPRPARPARRAPPPARGRTQPRRLAATAEKPRPPRDPTAAPAPPPPASRTAAIGRCTPPAAFPERPPSKKPSAPGVSDFGGRPRSCPFGGLTSAATLRPMRSSRSACRIARTSTL